MMIINQIFISINFDNFSMKKNINLFLLWYVIGNAFNVNRAFYHLFTPYVPHCSFIEIQLMPGTYFLQSADEIFASQRW